MTKKIMTLASALAAILPPLPATAAMPAELAVLATRNGASYARARATLAANVHRDDLRAYVAARPWAATTWRDDYVAEALLLHADNPRIGDALTRLRGLDPAVYLRLRRPEPVAGRELIGAGVPAAILMERYLKTFNVEAIHRSTYPAVLSADRVERLRRAERAALRTAILRAVGESRHRAAHHFLYAVARDEAGSIPTRRVAAISLGHTDAPATASLLRELVATGNPAVAAAAVIGAGQLRSAAGYEILAAAVTTRVDRDAQRAAVLGLSGFANAVTWPAATADNPQEVELRHAAAMRLVEAVGDPDAAALGDSLVQALAAANHPIVAGALRAIADDVSQSETSRDLAHRSLQLIEIAASRRR